MHHGHGLRDNLVAPACDEAADNEEVKIDEEDSTETEAANIAPDPGQPTRLQVEEHRIR